MPRPRASGWVRAKSLSSSGPWAQRCAKPTIAPSMTATNESSRGSALSWWRRAATSAGDDRAIPWCTSVQAFRNSQSGTTSASVAGRISKRDMLILSREARPRGVDQRPCAARRHGMGDIEVASFRSARTAAPYTSPRAAAPRGRPRAGSDAAVQRKGGGGGDRDPGRCPLVFRGRGAEQDGRGARRDADHGEASMKPSPGAGPDPHVARPAAPGKLGSRTAWPPALRSSGQFRRDIRQFVPPTTSGRLRPAPDPAAIPAEPSRHHASTFARVRALFRGPRRSPSQGTEPGCRRPAP